MLPIKMPRRVLPEVLDSLDADDARGRRSRRDLERVHVVMRSVTILRRLVAQLQLATVPRRIIELGAGDGTLLLRFARAQQPRWRDLELTLLDRVDLVSKSTRSGYEELGWRVTVERTDALAWAAAPRSFKFDLCVANLFLHHFDGPALTGLLAGVAASSQAFVACEPRRSAVAALGSRLMVLLGANDVTRQDAVTSVAAGFTGSEVSAAWPVSSSDWRLSEYAAPPFTHCFGAVRNDARVHEVSHGD